MNLSAKAGKLTCLSVSLISLVISQLRTSSRQDLT